MIFYDCTTPPDISIIKLNYIHIYTWFLTVDYTDYDCLTFEKKEYILVLLNQIPDFVLCNLFPLCFLSFSFSPPPRVFNCPLFECIYIYIYVIVCICPYGIYVYRIFSVFYFIISFNFQKWDTFQISPILCGFLMLSWWKKKPKWNVTRHN